MPISRSFAIRLVKVRCLGREHEDPGLQELGVKDVEIPVVSPKTEAERIEYALSDNDRAGYYEEKLLGSSFNRTWRS